MTWVAIAVGGAAVIGAGASYAGSKKQAKGAEKAGQLNMDMFNTLNQQQQPFIQSGYGAMGRLNTLLGLNPRPQPMMPSVPSSPAYRPTPGGGIQPIMQMGQPNVQIPEQGMGSSRLNQILSLRATHGDRQAAEMLQRLA